MSNAASSRPSRRHEVATATATRLVIAREQRDFEEDLGRAMRLLSAK
jgi:hypothetical protein